jgi:tetratricopeptide (TPR) repeat protein
MKNQIFKSVICLAALICLAGVARTYAQQQDGEEVRRYIRYAQTAYSRSEYSNALGEYQKALALVPNYPELYKAIGDVYEKLAATADLKAAITHYQRYLELAPDAADARQIRDKIYDLEYLSNEQEKQDRILDDLSGEWVAIDNLKVTKDDKEEMWFTSDVIFQIAEIQKTGKYSVTMDPKGSRFYSTNLIEKTVHIVPAKNNAFTFIFADATVYTPSAAGYDAARSASSTIKNDWIRILTEVAVTAAQERDLPSNTQTAYAFALRYEEGRLVGLVNIVGKYADPTRQQTTRNETHEITFVKRDDNFSELLRTAFDAQPDVLTPIAGAFSLTFKDKWGKKLSGKEIAGRLNAFDPQLGKQYRKANNSETAWGVTAIASSVIMGAGLGLAISSSSGNDELLGPGLVLTVLPAPFLFFAYQGLKYDFAKKRQLINQYNERITQQPKSEPTAELRFGITSSGGVGLILNF